MLNLNKSLLWTVNLILLFSLALSFNLKAQTYPVSDFDPNLQQVIAFPGAEGFGKYATGGRGGQVIKVTNLNDDGPGSLRAALEAVGPRIVVFEVSGNIQLKSNLVVRDGNLTIAGQTAPGDGITLQNYSLIVPDVNNVIIRFIRSRMGSLSKNEGDAFDSKRASNMIVDHCSFSWGTDETFSVTDGENITIQNSIISEGLNRAFDSNIVDHSFGSLLGGIKVSFYSNLMAHFVLRAPSITTNSDVVDLRNNIIYNWDYRSTNNGALAKANLFYNYYKPGPATKSQPSSSQIDQHFLWPTLSDNDPTKYGKFYLEGNRLEGKTIINSNQWEGVRLEDGDRTENYLETLKHKDQNGKLVPFSTPENLYSLTRSADEAYNFVLEFAGASLVRDAVDKRIVQETKNGTFTFNGSNGSKLGIIDSQKDVGGWPALKSLTAPKDTDGDGIPDDWEAVNGLDPNTTNDKEYNLSPYYTDIEIYINSLVQDLINKQNPGVPAQVNAILPANNETVSPVDISFAWQPLNNAQVYRLQISKSSDFSSNVVTINNIKNYSLVYPELDANSTYFWRVRASNASGNGQYSTIRSFKTSSLNTVPGRTILLSPETQQEGVGLSPLFKWAKVPNADSYRLQVSIASDFSSFVINQSSIGITEYQSPKLQENKIYYWRVRASNGSGNGNNSSPSSFKTLSFSNTPEPVVPVSPSNNVLINPLLVQLKWLEEPSAEKYQIQIFTDSNLSNRVYDNNGLTASPLILPNLESNKTYFWHIRGINRSGVGRYSAVNAFKTQPYPSPPNQVDIISPEDGANVFDTKITFQWTEEPIAQSYRFQLSTSSNFNSFVSNVGNLKGTSYTVSNLQSNTQYYWRVIASNEAGDAPASEIQKVRTATYSGTPASTNLISPANQAVVGAATILFEWENQPNTEYYRLDVSEQSNFSTYAFVKTSIPGTSFEVSGLNPNKTYYWRVRTYNPAGTGERSDTWSFNTIEKDLDLFPPILLNPQKASNFTNNAISFSWETVDNATGYHLQISELADFSTLSFQNQTITGTSFSLSSLASGKAYFWRLRAKANTVFSAWSDTWNFSIGSPEALLNSGLVGYWPMEEGSGNRMMDASGNNNHATILETTDVLWVTGKSGKSIRLNGRTGRYGVIKHNSGLTLQNALTLAAWVKPKEIQRGTIFYKSAGNGFDLWLDRDGFIEFRLNRTNNGSTYRIKSNFNYSEYLGKWIHVAATFDGSTSKIFINGKEDRVANYPSFDIGTTSGDLVIGALGDIQRWNGELDEVRLYDRALSNNEILMLTGQEVDPPVNDPPLQSTDLVGYWKLDEGSGNFLIDHSDYRNHATLSDNKGVIWITGKENLSLDLDGSSYGIVPHQPSLEFSNKITISAWVRPKGIGRRNIISKGSPDGFFLRTENNGKIEFRFNHNTNGTQFRLFSNKNYPTDGNTWMHVAVSFDGAKTVMYINGVQDNSATYGSAAILPNKTNIHLGAWDGMNRWVGGLDEVRLYNAVLSETEIIALLEEKNESVPQSVPEDELIGHWKMEEGTGNILIDHSGNSLSAIVDNNTSLNWTAGKEGLALSLDGKTFGKVPHQEILNLSKDLTITAWIRPKDLARRTIISKGSPDGFFLRTENNGKIEFRFNHSTNGSQYRIFSNKNYPNDGNTWLHVAVTFDGSRTFMYINGIEDNSETYGSATILPNFSDLQIGAWDEKNRWYGEMDEIRLYGRALNSSEISSLYTNSSTMRLDTSISKKNMNTLDSESISSETLISSPFTEENISPKLFPNPVDNEINVAPLWLKEGEIKVWIYDMKGSVLLDTEAEVYRHQLQIDILDIRLAPGNYMFVIQDNMNREVFRFLKK